MKNSPEADTNEACTPARPLEAGCQVISDVLVIPDVHGRHFWKHAVNSFPDLPTVFLGDYHDPYPQEGITEEGSLQNFIEILDYARSHRNVTLLVGNHDLHYFCRFGDYCRFDFGQASQFRKLFLDNFDLFRLMTWMRFGDKKVLFSHAPILKEWLQEIGLHPTSIQQLDSEMQGILNLVKSDPGKALRLLGYVSRYRGGAHPFGSPVWADIRELFKRHITELADYSIFGHTQLEKCVVIDAFADLDCRKPFLVTPELEIDSITY